MQSWKKKCEKRDDNDGKSVLVKEQAVVVVV